LKGSKVRESMCRRGSEVSGTGRGVKSIIIIPRRLRERNRLLRSKRSLNLGKRSIDSLALIIIGI
jgi:hypothetical protein